MHLVAGLRGRPDPLHGAAYSARPPDPVAGLGRKGSGKGEGEKGGRGGKTEGKKEW